MNAIELMEKWPGIAGADAATIFGMDAWALGVSYAGNDATLVKDATRERDVIGLEVKFDDEVHFLSIAVSDDYPELSKVWEQKAKLPNEILLALVEKECGALLQTLENAARRQLSVVGLVPREDVGAKNVAAQAFALRDADGMTVCDFALSLSPNILAEFGRVENLDANHESIRTLTRPARAEYAAFSLTDDELKGLAAGDHLLLPEIGSQPAKWLTGDEKADDLVHVLGPDAAAISFAAFADDALPEPPQASALVLLHKGRAVAEGRLVRLGEQPALAVEVLKS